MAGLPWHYFYTVVFLSDCRARGVFELQYFRAKRRKCERATSKIIADAIKTDLVILLWEIFLYCSVTCNHTHQLHTRRRTRQWPTQNNPQMKGYWVGLKWISTLVQRVHCQYVQPTNSGQSAHCCYLQSHTNVLDNVEKGAIHKHLMYEAKWTVSYQDTSTFQFYRMSRAQKTPQTSRCQEDIAILSFLSQPYFQKASKGWGVPNMLSALLEWCSYSSSQLSS